MKEPVKVLVVHSHESNQGSTILAVVRANPAGRKIAEAIGNTDNNDEVCIDEVSITEHIQLSNTAELVLRKIDKGTPLMAGDFRTIEVLISRGLVEQIANSGALPGATVAFRITPQGHAALAIVKKEAPDGRS